MRGPGSVRGRTPRTARWTATSRGRSSSAAVDHGMVLPTVTDGFTGSGPDLGALGVGSTAPHYGPRR